MNNDPTFARLLDALVRAETAAASARETATASTAAYEHRGWMQQAVQAEREAATDVQRAKDALCAYLVRQRTRKKDE